MADFGFEYTQRLQKSREDEAASGLTEMLRQAGLDGSGNAIPGIDPQPPIAPTVAKKPPSTVTQVSTGLIQGLQEGTASVLQDAAKASAVLDRAAEKINQWTGSKGGAFGDLAKTFESLSKKVQPSEADLKDKQSFIDYLSRAIGAAPPTVAEFVGGSLLTGGAVGGFALIEAIKASDQGTWETLKGAIKGALLGKGFEYLGQFSRLVRSAGTAALFGGQAALSGEPGAAIGAQAVAGALLGAVTPNKPKQAPKTEDAALTPEVLPKELPAPAERLALPPSEGLPKAGEAIRQPDLTVKRPGEAEAKVAVETNVAKTGAEADQFIQQKAGRPFGLERFIEQDEAAQKALALKPEEIQQVAPKIEQAAAEVGIQPREILSAAKIMEEIKVSQPVVAKAIEKTSSILAKAAQAIRGKTTEISESTRTLEAAAQTIRGGEPTLEAQINEAQAKARASQSGFSRTDLNLALARTLGGALYGYTQGDTTEERIQNALMMGGFAALVSPKLISGIVTKFKKIDPAGARQAELRDQGATPTADQAIKIDKASEQQIKDFFKLKPEDVTIKGRVEGINFDHINTPQDVKLLIGKVASVFHKEYSEARKIDPTTGEGVSHAETMAFAKSLGMTEETVLRWPDGQSMNRGEIQGARIVTVASARELKAKTDAYLMTPDAPGALEGFLNRFNKHVLITKNFLAQSSEVARTLESMKIDIAGDEVVFIRHLGDVVNNIDRTGWTPDRLAKALKDLPEQAQVNHFTRNIAKPGKADALLDLWYGASLLSNPKTLAVNLIGTPVAMGWQVGKRFLAAGMTQAMGKAGDPNYVQWSEPMNMLYGIRRGYESAWTAANDAFQRGEMTIGRHGKFEVSKQGAFKAETFGVDPGSVFGLGLDYLGQAARTFPRAMQATDQFLEVIGRTMEVGARVAREAAGKTGDPVEMAKLIREGVIEDNVPPGIKQAAEQFAVYNSFNSESGSFMASLQRGIESLKTSNQTMGPAYYLLAKAVAPFITIPTNIAKWTVREGPLGLLSENFWQNMRKGGADAQIALAGVSLGSIVMGTAAFLTKEGILTGRGPGDANERKMLEADGWQMYSVKIGGNYFKYDRLDPIAMPLGWAADLTEMAGHLDDADYFQAAASGVMAITRPLSNKTYLSGVSDFFGAIFSGESKKMHRWLSSEGASIVPGFVRGIRQQVDPYMREANTTMERLQSQIPGLSKDLPPVTDAFGRSILSGYGAGNEFVQLFGIINPIAYRGGKENRVINEIRANGVRVSTPSDTIYGTSDSPWDFKPPDARNGVKLQGWEYNAYKKTAGDWALNELGTLIDSDKYQRATPGPDGGKARMIQTVISLSREFGRRELLTKLPGLDELVRERYQERRNALSGGPVVPAQ